MSWYFQQLSTFFHVTWGVASTTAVPGKDPGELQWCQVRHPCQDVQSGACLKPYYFMTSPDEDGPFASISFYLLVFVCLFVYAYIDLLINLVNLWMYHCINLCFCLSICLFVCLFAYHCWSICLSVSLRGCPSATASTQNTKSKTERCAIVVGSIVPTLTNVYDVYVLRVKHC